MRIVSFVLPTYNEKANIANTLSKVFEQQKNLPDYNIHVVVADDVRSSDGTEQIIKQVIRKNNRVHFIKTDPGLGVGLIEGHRYALAHLHPDILAQLDADGQVEPDVLVRLVTAIEEGNSL